MGAREKNGQGQAVTEIKQVRVELGFRSDDPMQRRAGAILAALPRGLKRLYVMRLMAQDARREGTPRAIARQLATEMGAAMMADTDSLERNHERREDDAQPLGKAPADAPLRQHRVPRPLSQAPDSEPLHGQPHDPDRR